MSEAEVQEIKALLSQTQQAQGQHAAHPVHYIHIRTRSNGIPQPKGGYCLAVKRRVDGQWSVAVAQCPADRAYDKRLGKTIASARLRNGKYLVCADVPALRELADKLNEKISTGTLQVRVDLSQLDGQ